MWTYDGLDRLNAVKNSAGNALVGEYNSGGALQRRYVHGSDAGADDPLLWWEGAALRTVYADARGSIVLVRDSNGNTIGNYGDSALS